MVSVQAGQVCLIRLVCERFLRHGVFSNTGVGSWGFGSDLAQVSVGCLVWLQSTSAPSGKVMDSTALEKMGVLHTHRHIYTYVFVCVCVFEFVYIYAPVRTCIRICLCECLCLCLFVCIYTYIYTHMHIHMCVCKYVYIYMHTCTGVCRWYVSACMHLCV